MDRIVAASWLEAVPGADPGRRALRQRRLGRVVRLCGPGERRPDGLDTRNAAKRLDELPRSMGSWSCSQRRSVRRGLQRPGRGAPERGGERDAPNLELSQEGA